MSTSSMLGYHPGEHGPTGIGRALSRSSGAVADVLERLVTTGWALRTNDRPRRYRAAEAETAEPHPGRRERIYCCR